jgi:hypothetical protein
MGDDYIDTSLSEVGSNLGCAIAASPAIMELQRNVPFFNVA